MGDLSRPDGTRLSVRRQSGASPTIIFLPGYASDMEGTKALTLDAWAEAKGRAFVRFDYGGCGISEGVFEDQTLVDWLGDALAVIDATEGLSCWSARRWAAGWRSGRRWRGPTRSSR